MAKLRQRYQRYGQTDRQTDKRTTYSWAPTRGAQLTAGYTVNTYSKPPVYYTLGAVAPLLPCLRTPAVIRTAVHDGTHTTRAWRPSAAIARTDRRTRDTTFQPANRTAAVLPVTSCKLGTVVVP